MKVLVDEVKKVLKRVNENHVAAYAAQSAFFFILSMIPLMLLLLAAVQYTTLTKADVMTAVVKLIPETHMQGFLVNIVNEVYNQSRSVIPITAITALWSASKAVLAMTQGLNGVYKCKETRNYILVRVSASAYTVVFIAAILLMLILPIFGSTIAMFFIRLFPFWEGWVNWIMNMRTLFSFVLILMFISSVYSILPNRKGDINSHWVGAVFTTVAWLAISFVFSMYLTIFQGFTGLYGSMTAIILVMLWLYFCMYAILLGGMFNQMMREKKAENGLTSEKGVLE